MIKTRQMQFLDAHGLIKHDMPRDGCCLFPLCWISHETRETSGANALRDVAADTLELNTDGFHAVWDGRLPNGTAAQKCKAFVKQIRLAGEYGGELEILVLARTLDLTFCGVRPGQPTVQVGKGMAALWLLSRNRHHEPLSTSADKAAVACRRGHAKSIEKCLQVGFR